MIPDRTYAGATPWTRRKALTGGAAVAVSAISRGARAASNQTLTLCSYSGVFERIYRRAVVEPFMRAHPGIAVSFYGVPTSAQMLAMLRVQRRSPQIDVCLLDVVSAKVATDENLLQPLDRKSIPTIAELHPHATVAGVAGPAVTFDHLMLLYAPQHFPSPPRSWKLLWDKEQEGRIAIQRPPHMAGLTFTLIANYMAGETDYARSYEPGIASVARMAPNVLNWDPRPDPYMFIINGSAALGVGWNARAQLYASESPGRIASVLPQESTIATMNMITQVREARHPGTAQMFIDYALGVDAQSRFAEQMFYTPTNSKVTLSAAAASRTATKAQMDSMLPMDWLQIARIRDRMSQEWRTRILLRR